MTVNGFIALVNNENFQCLFIFLVVMAYLAVAKIFGRR